MRPNSYIEQGCCADCEHVFERTSWEDNHEYYCHIDKSKRPKCGSGAMKESFVVNGEGLDEQEELYEKWEAWAEPRAVKSWGRCGEYKHNKGRAT